VTINGGCGQDMSVFRDAGQGQEMTNSRSEKSQPRAGYRCPLHNSAFGWIDQASSASFFSQVEMPLGFALRRYSAFSAFVQRTWICSVARSLAGRDGRPLPRLGTFMGLIMGYTNIPCNPSLGMI
jgi:hypothetical protein